MLQRSAQQLTTFSAEFNRDPTGEGFRWVSLFPPISSIMSESQSRDQKAAFFGVQVSTGIS